MYYTNTKVMKSRNDNQLESMNCVRFERSQGLPKELQLQIDLPTSKSISNRALILHALSGGSIYPDNLSDCDDTQVMIRALTEENPVIDIHAAGTAMRFLTAYYSVTPGEHILTGTERMKQRPIRLLVDALRSLGADISYTEQEGYPPLLIRGGNFAGREAEKKCSGQSAETNDSEITLAGNVSSQYISALLMIGPSLPKGLTLHLTGELISVPYIHLTLQLMKAYGAVAQWNDKCTLRVEPGRYRDVPFKVESDWSAASYWYEVMALWNQEFPDAPAPSILLKGLQPHSAQGDSRGAELFAKLGVHTVFTDEGVRLTKLGTPVARMVENLVDIPDLAQTFVVTCCLMGIPFRFTGLQTLKIKETDRIKALQQELHKLGFVVKDEQDSILSWNGERCPADTCPSIATYDDHRMAMSFAPAILCAAHLGIEGLVIEHPEVVRKSYPSFWNDFRFVPFKE